MNTKGQVNVVFAGTFIICLVVGIAIAVAGFDYVPAGHIGVKDRMGIVDDQPWGPGVKWTGLFTSTQSFTTRVQLKEYDATAASKDLQVVNTKVALNFKLDPQKAAEIYKTIGVNYQDVIIAPIVQESVKSSTAKYTADNLVQQRSDVKADITDYITLKLSEKGMIVTEVAITDFAFSDEYNTAIEQKQVAEQDALTAKNRLEEMKYTSESMKLQSEVLEIKKLDIELEKLSVQRAYIEKWNGQMPNLLMTGSDSSKTLLNIATDNIISEAAKN